MIMSPALPLLLILVVALLALALIWIDPRARLHQQHVEATYAKLSARVSERLDFRRPERSDLDFYLQLSTDPVAAENNGWSGREAEWVRKRFDSSSLFDQMRASEIVAVERESGTRVGTATFTRSPLDKQSRSIGIHIHPDHRNQGYGRELMAAAIVLLQMSPGPVHVGTRVTNIGLQRIMEQLGYEPQPVTRPYTAPDGNSYEAYWYTVGDETHPPVGVKPA